MGWLEDLSENWVENPVLEDGFVLESIYREQTTDILRVKVRHKPGPPNDINWLVFVPMDSRERKLSGQSERRGYVVTHISR